MNDYINNNAGECNNFYYSRHPEQPSYSDAWKYHRGWVTESEIPLDELITKVCWSPIVFKNGSRSESNFLYADFGAIDCDGGYDLKQAIKDWQDSCAIIGTTKSHTEQDHCFRIVFKWQTRITSLEHYRYNINKIVEQYDSDAACVDGARFFWPCKTVEQKLDTDHGIKQPVLPLPANWMLKAEKEKILLNKYRNLGNSNIFPSHIKSMLKGNGIDGQRNTACYQIGKTLRLWGMEPDEIIALVAASKVPLNNNRATIKEAENAARNGIRKAEKIIKQSKAQTSRDISRSG